MKLVFTGIQGCGKGTHGRILVEKYGYTLIEMGGEFRKVIESGSELGVELKEIMDKGYQVPGELGKKIMEDAIKNNIEKENIVFDAFVRNDRNKEIFDRLLPDYKVVFFDLSKEKALGRLLGRMYDTKTGETFPSGTIVNPKTGNTLIKRSDDNEEGILKRIDEFVTKTLPIVKIQEQEGRVIKINSDQSIEDVSKELVLKLGL
ncbi:MAG: nucleoside monophosphate kinase [Candidatus Gracilibacteria bacterium]